MLVLCRSGGVVSYEKLAKLGLCGTNDSLLKGMLNNHTLDFQTLDGRVPLDFSLAAENTKEDIILNRRNMKHACRYLYSEQLQQWNEIKEKVG